MTGVQTCALPIFSGTYIGDTLQDAINAANAENVSTYGSLIEPPELDENAVDKSCGFKFNYYKSS